MKRNIEIATEIRTQLGNGTLFMLGAKNLKATTNPEKKEDPALSFRIRGSRTVNYILISLNAMDTYDMTFGVIRANRKAEMGFTYKIVAQHDGMYADQLHEMIEKETGLSAKAPLLYVKGKITDKY